MWYIVLPQTSCSLGQLVEWWLVGFSGEGGNFTCSSAFLTNLSTSTSSLHVSFCAYTWFDYIEITQ